MQTTDSTQPAPPIEHALLLLGNSNKRFSGVTSTMLQTMALQQENIPLRVLGPHHLPDPSFSISFRQLALAARTAAPGAPNRVFHARRNDEMIQALLIKHLFRGKLKIIFTSTAQRHHSGFTRWLMSKMDGIISTCNAAASYLQTPPDVIIAHGVDTTVYQPADDRNAAWQATGLPGKRGIGIFGRVRAQKGVDIFVRACIEQLPDYPDFTGVIVGSITPDNQQFVDQQKALLRDAGLADRVVFLGEQPFERIPVLMRAMSVICALSLNEGYGLTVPEAMSSGVAVLSSDAGAWPEVVQHGRQGWVVPAGDSAAATTQLGAMLADPQQLEQMGRDARSHVLTHYDIRREADALIDYYRRFL